MRKTTSIKIEPDMWQQFKIHCIKKQKDISDILEEMIKEELKKDEG